MRRLAGVFLIGMLAVPAVAENRAGGRYSNYATDLGIIGFSIDTERESSLGILGQFESGPIIIKAQYDHDFEAGLGFLDFINLDLATLQRDRFEGSVGWRVADYLTLEGAGRYDSLTASSGIFGGFDDVTLDGGQFGFGATAHSAPADDFRWYVTGRYFFGSVDIDNIAGTGLDGSIDTNGLRVEIGVPIGISDSQWVVVPGLEYERYETDSSLIEIESNRFFIALQYAF
ncbi:MAG: porin family protein [Acidobacteria bacterium]|nr:porin family protein [Acidobacteriota bacterium]